MNHKIKEVKNIKEWNESFTKKKSNTRQKIIYLLRDFTSGGHFCLKGLFLYAVLGCAQGLRIFLRTLEKSGC